LRSPHLREGGAAGAGLERLRRRGVSLRGRDLFHLLRRHVALQQAARARVARLFLAARARRRVLTVEASELLIDVGIAPARLERVLEERFADDGEELGGMLGR